MNPVRQTEKRYCSAAMTVAIIIGSVLIVAALRPIAKGLILGTLFSIINFILIGETLPKRMAGSARKGFLLALGSIFFRYALMAIPLFVAIKLEEFNLYAAIAGIFMVQIVILADHFFRLIFSPETRKNALWKN